MNEDKNEKNSRPSGLIFQENKTPLAAPPTPLPLHSHHCELLEAALDLQWHSVYQLYLSKWSIVIVQ